MRTTATSTLLLSGLACTIAAYAQTSPTTGALRGSVVAKAGGAVGGARVDLRNRETGLSRTLTTDAQGQFLAGLLPPGDYEVSVTAKGMQSMKDRNVRIQLGQTTPLTFRLESADVGAVVEVTAKTTSVDATQISAQTSISQEVVETIPVNGRNFTDLVLLTPGAGANSEGYRQTIEGARGVQNNLQIDGMSFNSKFNGEQRGGTRIPNAFGQDTIRELQVVTNAFDAQYGDSAGAVINAISKTGTNDLAGSAMVLFRPNWGIASIKAAPAGGAAQNTPEARKREFDQQNYGFTLGGPIIKDKLHFFVGAEMFKDNIGSIPTLTPGSAGNAQSDMDTFFGATGLGGRLVTTNDGRTMAQELGTPWTNTRKNTTAFARLDWTINPAHRATLRLNSQNYTAENNTYSGSRRTDVAASNNARHEFKSTSWVAELSSILADNLINEARVQLSTEARPSTPNSTASSEIRVGSSSATFRAGQYYIEPRDTKETLTQFQDNLTWMSGDWQVKGGVDLQFIHFKNLYYPNKYGSWTFGSYAAANAWVNNPTGTKWPTSYANYYQNYSPLDGISDFKERFFAGFVQAQYQGLLEKRLLLSLGLRYTSEAWDDNPNPNAKLAGLDRVPNSSSVDPRFGFTLDVTGKSQTLVRGGYGWFSVSNPAQTTSGAIMNNGINMLGYKLDTGQSNHLAYFMSGGVLSAAQRFVGNRLTPVTPDQLKAFTAGAVAGTVIDPEAKMARAEAMSLALEHDFQNGWTTAVRATRKKFKNLQYFVNINLGQYNESTGLVDPAAFYNDGYASKYNKFSTSLRPNKAMVRGRMLDLTGFGDVGLSRYDGEGLYRNLVVEGAYKHRTGWGFSGNVTIAKAEDNNSNERATAQTTAGNTYNPADPLSAYAISDNDRAVRTVLAFWAPTFYGVRVSGVLTHASGLPYTAQWADDINGDGVRNDPAFGVRNNYRQPYDKTFDLRISRSFTLYKTYRLETIVDVYNVLNWDNQKTSKYNFGQKPGGNIYSDFGAIDRQDTRTRELQFTAKIKF